ASANTAVSPAPINAQIRIALAGTNPQAGTAGLGFVGGSEGSSVRGLAIYDFADLAPEGTSAANITLNAPDITVAGNFIGVQADGVTVGEGQNDTGILITGSSTNYNVGGTAPADRNILYPFSVSNVSAAIFGGA